MKEDEEIGASILVFFAIVVLIALLSNYGII